MWVVFWFCHSIFDEVRGGIISELEKYWGQLIQLHSEWSPSVGQDSLRSVAYSPCRASDEAAGSSHSEAAKPSAHPQWVHDSEDLPQYWNFLEQRLITPTSSSITIIQTANEVLKKIYREGYQYKKAGVIVMNIEPDSPIQQDLFDINAEQIQKMHRLDEVIDRINRMHGSETIVLGSQQYTRKDGKGKADVFANAIKHDFRSPSPTTRWSDVIKLK